MTASMNNYLHSIYRSKYAAGLKAGNVLFILDPFDNFGYSRTITRRATIIDI